MAFCINCFKKIDSMREPCPHCGAPALYKSNESPDIDTGNMDLDNIPEAEKGDVQKNLEIQRLLKRGIECFNKGKAWVATNDRARAKKDFQRAVKYFERVLKLDPSNREARDFRTKSVQKMA
jgi:tetratricopeptide (TPR) repeat protein